ncbi:glycosyltransferase family 39 protein [Clostridium sp. MSJ-4]|uniref:Glycosyltransferase family 39 protein n=1 Tax=Clostridium simiarum TaxID=2841506 RepID=A0ABS6F422_9CLOT|nr:glycosyltransferase family 39 protein [Clostridium simiarum]MBU5593262.1 glycosyltransferase family 39 protein [Clostridium simiarum]
MFSMKYEKKNIKYALYIITALFFIICVITSLKYGDYNLLGSYEKMDNDDVRYIRSAWTILDTGILSYHNPGEKTVFIMPGISYTLAFFMKIFGRVEGVMAFRIFQGVLQSLSIFIIFFIGRKLFNSRVGFWAAIIDVFYIPEIWATNVILTETIFKFFLVLLIYISIYAIEEKQFKYYIWGGAVWGLATLYRPTIAAFPMVILFMWIYKKYEIRDMLKFGIVTTVVFAIIMSPWWVRNYKVFGEFIPLTLSSGNPMVEGSYINYDESIDYYAPERSDDVIEQNKLYIENVKYRFKHVMLKRPFAYAKWYFIDKGLTLWTVAFYWKEIWGISRVVVMIYHILILILGIIGMIKYLRKARRSKNISSRSYDSYSLGIYRASTKSSISSGKILFFVLIFFYITHIPYITFSRYGYPTMFIFMIYATYLFFGE